VPRSTSPITKRGHRAAGQVVRGRLISCAPRRSLVGACSGAAGKRPAMSPHRSNCAPEPTSTSDSTDSVECSGRPACTRAKVVRSLPRAIRAGWAMSPGPSDDWLCRRCPSWRSAQRSLAQTHSRNRTFGDTEPVRRGHQPAGPGFHWDRVGLMRDRRGDEESVVTNQSLYLLSYAGAMSSNVRFHENGPTQQPQIAGRTDQRQASGRRGRPSRRHFGG